MTNHIPDQSHLINRKSKKVLIALPPAILADLDWVAGIEHTSRSELIRQCIRDFLRSFKRSHVQVVTPHPENAVSSISVIEESRYLTAVQ